MNDCHKCLLQRYTGLGTGHRFDFLWRGLASSAADSCFDSRAELR